MKKNVTHRYEGVTKKNIGVNIKNQIQRIGKTEKREKKREKVLINQGGRPSSSNLSGKWRSLNS